MIIHPKKHLLLPLLALSMTLAMVAPGQAEERRDRGSGGTAVSLQINLGTRPHWMGVQGTRVQVMRERDRIGYDMFRYGRYYYVYNDNRWYRSRRSNGRFTWIDDRYVPSELRRVPRGHWRNYPSAWDTRHNQGPGGRSMSLQVNFGSRPRWVGIYGTRVEEIPLAQRPGYDVFRYDGSYYAYNDNCWYSSNRESGDFTWIDERDVPSEFSRVPRDHWRNYPGTWDTRSNQGSGGGSMSLQVNFGSRPRWVGIYGTRVEEIPLAQRPGYDVFRYDGSYYAYNNNRWYSSDRESGDFTWIDERDVPSEFSRIPRDHWRNYPGTWQNENGGPTGRENRNDYPDSRGSGR